MNTSVPYELVFPKMESSHFMFTLLCLDAGKAAQQVNVLCPKRLRCLICNKL
ncbi:hypothetical protein POPTR_009G035950v4 [Populus trichocarpa]|uniref:Uncharacterized protein n=1 Tax=Populus trichocarpa TaxID=3694 RepID=A0ACC0SGE8_POPTR|nr:hypothetical protein POPTR_009G035950v4 [Populus trichocarpa]